MSHPSQQLRFQAFTLSGSFSPVSSLITGIRRGWRRWFPTTRPLLGSDRGVGQDGTRGCGPMQTALRKRSSEIEGLDRDTNRAHVFSARRSAPSWRRDGRLWLRRVSSAPHRGGCFPRRVPRAGGAARLGRSSHGVTSLMGPAHAAPKPLRPPAAHGQRWCRPRPRRWSRRTSRVEKPLGLTAQDGLVSILRAAEVNRRVGALPRSVFGDPRSSHRYRRSGPSGRPRLGMWPRPILTGWTGSLVGLGLCPDSDQRGRVYVELRRGESAR